MLAIGFAAVLPGAVTAGEPRQQAIAFDIASQSLEEALNVYSSMSDVQVLYETSLTSGRRSTTVRGVLAPQAALQALLAGTGLTARYTAYDSYTIVPEPVPLSPRGEEVHGLRSEIVRYDHFLGALQGRILDALCRSPDTQPGVYRVRLSFRIAASGAVLQTSLLDSTGDNGRDAAIVGAVGRLKVDQIPPAELPQPITMVVAPRPVGATGECASANTPRLKR